MMTNTRHDSFIELVKDKLARFDNDIERLQREDESALTLESLRKQRDHVHGQLSRLEHAGDDEWSSIRPNVERAVTNLGETLESAKSRTHHG